MTVLNDLKGGFVASCQPVTGGPMDRTDIIVAMARAAVDGGASGLRIEGVENVRAVRSAVAVPIIGIVKRDLPDTPVRITPYIADAEALVEAGADIIAYDGTSRPMPDARPAIVRAILDGGRIAMADCSTEADARTALADGAAIVCGGGIPVESAQGFFIEPTILRDVRPEMKVAAEEIFAPVLPVISFGDDDDEIAMANDVPYGLAAYVFTKDLSNALRAADGIESGSVCVNEVHYAVHLPHGGLKQSGVGKDCSRYSIEEYLTLKRVSILM